MGVFSKLNRFREAGEETNVNNVERYGTPVRSLFTVSKVVTVHHEIDIVDSNDNVVYSARTKFPSLHDKTDITDANGSQVAHIEKKILTLHERHIIEMADGKNFEFSNEIFHLIKDVTNIEGLGWQLRGNILGLNFELYDKNDDIIAVIAQKMISLHDKWCVDIYNPDVEKEVVAILITLQHMVKDRENSSSSSSVSVGSAE